MDSFVKSFFPDMDTPGAPFKYDTHPYIWCYSSGNFETRVQGFSVHPFRKQVMQPMTPMGFLTAQMEGMGSSYEGISEQFLTSEGLINLPAISKQFCCVYSMLEAESWPWQDNHVSLIFNMMRYSLLKKIAESTGSLNAVMGNHDEDNLSIDMDQWWTPDYPETAPFNDWPTDITEQNSFMIARHLVEAVPETGSDAIDLRSLTEAEAVFVLIMLNAWNRSSRMRLDFSTPRLTDRVYFRGPDVEEIYNGWVNHTGKVEMLGAEATWLTCCRYVSSNRLYHAFSVAIYLVAFCMYQFVPETAEGTAWLSVHWRVTIPHFSSVRGRYTFFNTGTGAFLTARPRDEYKFFSVNLEKLHLLALVFSQGFFSGLAIRTLRRSIQMEHDELMHTFGEFHNPYNYISNAVAEFTRKVVPCCGLMGIMITAEQCIEESRELKVIRTRNLVTEVLPETHQYGRVETTVVGQLVEVVAIAAVPKDYPNRAEVIENYNLDREVAERRREIKKNCHLSRAETLALNGQVELTFPQPHAVTYWTVEVQALPMPGYPVFLAPVHVADFSTPFDEAGVINEALGNQTSRANKVNIRDAWLILSYLNNVGYTFDCVIKGEIYGAKKFLVGSNSRQLWPVMYKPDSWDDPVLITGQHIQLVTPQCCHHYMIDSSRGTL